MSLENTYLTHTEYINLGGELSLSSFKILEYKAEKLIDLRTFNRFRKLNEYPLELKMCILELIEIYNNEDNSGIISESIGNYSVTKQSKNESRKEKENIIKQYLSEVKVNGVFVLYCGGDIIEN